jgi:REP element-mobilizing transposase RayT
MARRTRRSDAGYVYHVLNRAVGRVTLFDKPADYAAFEKVIRQAWERTGMRLLSYAAMPDYWHLVAMPDRDGQLSTWAQWFMVTRVRRWHAHRAGRKRPASAGTKPNLNPFSSVPPIFRRKSLQPSPREGIV